ncbi:MAG: protein-glutamate O-methyltransferase CheR [Syntrophomonadaceae bacterium]|nr:protein-glutamate O-methyltransferase CheR [Syntrophomonadaceae bacterium]MDD3024377.1 protein-glutamate O-methyltransferase CheR [Syntrophomonadaceae bacterium]
MSYSLSHREFTMLQKYIEEQSGIILGEEKAYFIESRLAKILENYSLSSYEELYYKAYSKKDASFSKQVIDAITTNETYWFRDKSPWYIMEDLLLPVYIKEMQAGQRADVRIWSSACSSGQEPYSIAMCIDNYLRINGIQNIGLERFHIAATDLSESMLKLAIKGKYDSVSMERGLDTVTVDRYFVKNGNQWLIDEKIKKAVSFQQINLKRDHYYFDNCDIIFCRYVLMYFSEILKEVILPKVINALKPQGVLFTGASEIMKDSTKCLEMETYKDGVYFRLKG